MLVHTLGEPHTSSDCSTYDSVPALLCDPTQVQALRDLMRPIARNNTVIVTPVNEGFLVLGLNLHCRLRALGSTNHLLWALDRATARELSAQDIRHYYDPDLYSVEDYVGYYDSRYIQMMAERPLMWWRMLATGFDILFLDADVVAFDWPERAFARLADLEIQVDGWKGWLDSLQPSAYSGLCAGAFWMRSCNKTKEMMDGVARTYCKRDNTTRWDDQQALNTVALDPQVATFRNWDDPPRDPNAHQDLLEVLHAPKHWGRALGERPWGETVDPRLLPHCFSILL